MFICEKPYRGFLVSFLISGFYEFILLVHFDYKKYLFDNNTERSDFITANKEGLFSALGYVSIYLSGQAICIFLKESVKKNCENIKFGASINNMLKSLCLIVFLLYGGFELAINYVDLPSRRICNMSFVYFIVSQIYLLLKIKKN